MFGPAYFLDGDSFPSKCRFEAALHPRIASSFSDWIGQREILDRTGQQDFPRGIPKRLQLLERLLPEADDAARAILIGRSAGARVATLFAMKRKVAAVICLGYPFRNPRKILEPGRYIHLGRITVPTLILQGVRDAYGDAAITETYPLSSSVTVKLIDTDHDCVLPSSGLDGVARTILDYCAAVSEGTPIELSRFDEPFYLRLYRDVAKGIAAGKWASGQDHFKLFGRQQRRRYRLLHDA